ncbi:MAG: ABC transporter ATP-binding protein [Planctomycetes bacterium]|nr:ABC transporter ATP-binding protein [Planctomycetota bacterium]
MNDAAPALAFADVTRTFGARERGRVTALRSVSWQASAGRITGLVGPDGAGKTTSLRLAAGLLTPDAGSVRTLGLDPTSEVGAVRDRIGYMPQRFGLYEDLSVRENLDLFADLQGVEPRARPARFERLMRIAGLGPFLDRRAGQLSGGMKQKLGLACALIKEPELLLLDEPSVGVDPVSRRELWAILDELVSERGIGVVVATAYLDEAERCAEVVVLDRGEVLDHGPPARFATTQRGRVAELVPGPGETPRRLQVACVELPATVDATIRAGRVRVVSDEPTTLQRLAGEHHAELRQAVEPCFEDAFMARLAGRHERLEVERRSARPSERASDEVTVRVRDLRKRFGTFEAVRGVSFDVRRGEVFGLLGPNGAGKTTTFRMLCGLTAISAGEATVAGHDLRRSGRKARAKLGYMAQSFSLYGSLSVAQNLRFFGTVYGLRGRILRARIDATLGEFGLLDLRDEEARRLTAGYKQRLSMAAALLHEPDILFLDEPTSGVDPLARREFWQRINAVALDGTTIVVTTHFLEEAEFCDRMLIMARGSELALGTPDEIRARARSDAMPDPTIEDAFIALAQQQEDAA